MTALITQRDKADLFRKLHGGPPILVLPNAWDAASARIFEEAGFPSIASTSAGVAATLGYPDGQRISRDEMIGVVKHIAAAVSVPVTADMEAGYGEDAEAAAETARAVLRAGAIGLNFEDTDRQGKALLDVPLQVERIRAMRQVADEAGIPLVINARTDVYLLRVGEPESRFEHAVRRANAYREAGADCLFVPGVSDPDTITRLARAISGPLNVLAVAGTPPASELERAGVARVSVGSGPMRATVTLTRRIATELRERGTYTSFTDGVLTHQQVNELLAPR